MSAVCLALQGKIKISKIKLPNEDNDVLYFKDVQKQLKVWFITGRFWTWCYLEKCDEQGLDLSVSFTQKKKTHTHTHTQDVLKIRIEDIFSNLKKDKVLFDTSEYSSNHFLFSTRNKKVFGKMKHEINGIPIQEFGWSPT